MTKKRHVLRSSLVLVGEGACDKAFLEYMKAIYDSRDSNQTVKIESANGGSPKDIINVAINKSKNAAYDKQYILMDSDIPISDNDLKFAKSKRITLLHSTPICLEGMLLEVLGQKVPATSKNCKTQLKPFLAGDTSRKESYKTITKQILDETENETIIELRKLISNKYD